MKRVWFVVPVHGREELTRVCLRQLRRTCDAMREYDLEATAVVIGTDASVDLAYDLGFATVARDNAYLGRKFNDGYQLALDPEFNPEPADYVVPCGSDDWIDHRVFETLPREDTIGIFRHIAAVSEDRTRLGRIKVVTPSGAGIRIMPRALLERVGYRPADEDRKRAIDMSTFNALVKANSMRHPRMVALDVHDLQIVDWKTHGEQLNTYKMLVSQRKSETTDVFAELAEHYPAEALEEMQALGRERVAA